MRFVRRSHPLAPKNENLGHVPLWQMTVSRPKLGVVRAPAGQIEGELRRKMWMLPGTRRRYQPVPGGDPTGKKGASGHLINNRFMVKLH